MSTIAPIVVWNRATGHAEREQVYGDTLIRWLYGSGRPRVHALLTRHWISRLVGSYQSSALSRSRIAAFVRTYGVVMDDYEPGPFRSFNDFFIRRFRADRRPFHSDPNTLAAFAEGRYLAYQRLREGETLPVKGAELSAAAILADADTAAPFRNGPAVIARLCPVDYHRFHYPDDGRTLAHYAVSGRLHSVNPIALCVQRDVFSINERRVSILETAHLGRLAYVEVGALCVGRIVATHPTDQPFRRGDEKGYFLFGASTVIVFGEAGRWRPDADLLDQTAQHRETLVRLGERIATAP